MNLSRKQRTVKTEASISGIGLHTGETTTLTVKPAPPNTGILFRRVDIDRKPEIRANLENTTERLRRTAIALGVKAEVHTIEHLMACMMMIRLDNAYIEIDGLEIPGLDGSAVPFLDLLDSCGAVEQDASRQCLTVPRPISLTGDMETSIIIQPYDGLRISYLMDYQPDIPLQYFCMDIDEETFRSKIAPARTFCLAREVEDMKTLGLGKGATYDNTLVVEPGGKPHANECRFPDEYVRHKVLDLLGDLALAERDFQGHIIAIKSGHKLNREFTIRLCEEGYWDEIEKLLASPPVLDLRGVLRCLPHRYPMLLLDKIVYLDFNGRAIGVKNVTFNEEFFQGHFPGQPVMPGVLICEAMAQLGCTLIIEENDTCKTAFLIGMDNIKIRNPIVPGDTVVIIVEAIKLKTRFGAIKGQAFVNRQLMAEAELKCMIVDVTPK
ncbi:UDP-3-O-acyl-N-acetylglucosamine deacetylase [Planctomycetota bacterium]